MLNYFALIMQKTIQSNLDVYYDQNGISNVETLIKYYHLFKSKEHNLKVATIFSYQANEEDKDALGFTTSDFDEVDLNVVAEPKPEYNSKHTREHLDNFIADYNKTFGTNYSTKDTQSYYNYYNDIAKSVKHRQVDILLYHFNYKTSHLSCLFLHSLR